jgi:hypothetical protein
MSAADDQNVVVVESAHRTIISGKGREAKPAFVVRDYYVRYHKLR